MSLQAPETRISKGGSLREAERYVERALHFMDKKKFDKAVLDLDDAINTEPYNAEYYATRAYVLALSGEYAEAENDVKQALEKDPRQWVAHYIRGYIAFEQQKFDDALGHFAMAQRVVPLRPEMFIYRAACYFHRNDYRNADKEIDSALQLLEGGDPRLKEAKSWQRAIKQIKGR